MKTKVARWGNSLALRLPKQVAISHDLKEGIDLEITEKNGGFFIRPAAKKYDLSTLLKGVSKTNLHSESFSDTPVGEEAW